MARTAALTSVLLLLGMLSNPTSAFAATPVGLGAAGTYSVLAATMVTSTGATTISGDLGVSPGTAVVGFPPGTVTGAIRTGSDAAQAQTDLLNAYDNADARTPTSSFAGDNNGRTYTPGVHHTAAAFALTGTMTLDGQGDPNAVFIFQIDAALNTAAASHINLVNGATAPHVFWQVLGAAGTGATSSFTGTIMAAGAITIGAGATLAGRALSRDTVTLAGNTITTVSDPAITITGGATASTNDTTPTITGTTDAPTGTTLTVTITGQTSAEQTLTTTVQPNGTWATTAAPLPDGTHTVTASVADAAGNTGTATQTLTVLGGTLSITAPADAGNLGSGAPTVGGGIIRGALGRVQVSDMRQADAGSGWVASVSSTPFSTPAGDAIPASAVGYAAGPITKTGTATYTAKDPGELTGVAPAITATEVAGDNSATWNPEIIVAIPDSAIAGVYSGTITHSVL